MDGGEPKAAAAVDQLGLTAAELVRERWGVRLDGPLLDRFTEPGWSYQELVPRTCPECGGALHSLPKLYESQGRVYL